MNMMETDIQVSWTSYHLSENNKGCALVGTKTSHDNKKKQQHNDHDFECLYFVFVNHHICVVL